MRARKAGTREGREERLEVTMPMVNWMICVRFGSATGRLGEARDRLTKKYESIAACTAIVVYAILLLAPGPALSICLTITHTIPA